MEGPQILFRIPIYLPFFPFENGIPITDTVVNSWLIILAVLILCLVLTHKMEKIPVKKTQIIAEKIVVTIDNLVESTMGKKFMRYAPFILALMTFSLCGSLISLLGARPVTADFNTTLGWALVTFTLIQWNNIKAHGFVGYLKGFIQPVAFLLPINIVSEIATPISMSFRHFGNLAAGVVITELVYSALASFSTMLFSIDIPILQIGLPAVLSIYFDLFTAVLQAFIFCMLTMVFISNAASD
ncbi:MAG: F0F1 ATP synthase subunit A [Oscillospiraceae bacterium]|nr:F0F1 ATP synthase subunit A [Oscillospiraceae bacterium]